MDDRSIKTRRGRRRYLLPLRDIDEICLPRTLWANPRKCRHADHRRGGGGSRGSAGGAIGAPHATGRGDGVQATAAFDAVATLAISRTLCVVLRSCGMLTHRERAARQYPEHSARLRRALVLDVVLDGVLQ